MITAEQARKNLVPVEDVLKDYLAKEIEPAIREASIKRTGIKFKITLEKKGWVFSNLVSGESWRGYSFNKVNFTNEVIDVLEKNGYKTEVNSENASYLEWRDLVVSWGEE